MSGVFSLQCRAVKHMAAAEMNNKSTQRRSVGWFVPSAVLAPRYETAALFDLAGRPFSN
jgi:hypothetical protein